MKKLGLLLMAMLLFGGTAQAADVPDALGNIFEGIAAKVTGAESLGAARVIGLGSEGDNKTIALAATPIEFNGEKVRKQSGRLTLTLDYVYDPTTVTDLVLSQDVETDFYGGIGGRADYAIGSEHIFVAAGVGLVSEEISSNRVAGYVAAGYTWAIRE